MNRVVVATAVAAAFVLLPFAHAQNENPLTRDEVSVVKKKLVSMLEALGNAPAGYAMESEHFSLPTQAYKNSEGSLYNPIGASADRSYGTQKNAEKASEDLQKEYQKKMAEAQAKGDYVAMSKLAQEMQKKSGEIQLKAVEGRKDPIRINVHLNSNPGATIDPDAVVFERAGVIALKSTAEGSQGQVWVYFDPAALKDTKQLSRVDMKMPDGGVAKRMAVLNATIEFSGPPADIQAWAKTIDTKKVLAQIDSAR
jgi:hypothetical protein